MLSINIFDSFLFSALSFGALPNAFFQEYFKYHHMYPPNPRLNKNAITCISYEQTWIPQKKIGGATAIRIKAPHEVLRCRLLPAVWWVVGRWVVTTRCRTPRQRQPPRNSGRARGHCFGENERDQKEGARANYKWLMYCGLVDSRLGILHNNYSEINSYLP